MVQVHCDEGVASHIGPEPPRLPRPQRSAKVAAMILRKMPPSMDAAIDARVAAIADEEQVAIPLTVESGSRAWGFPSPDSDFDCRFVFIRRAEDYLSPWPRRDVIEVALDAELDINGWELGKALNLLLKGNAVIIEWLTSAIIYGADGKDVPLKKAFYALRPSASLRWLRMHPGEAIAPMSFPQLIAECEPPAEPAGLIADLLARKAVTRELGSGPVPFLISAFVDAEFQCAQDHPLVANRATARRAKEAAEAFFLTSIARLAPAGGGNRG